MSIEQTTSSEEIRQCVTAVVEVLHTYPVVVQVATIAELMGQIKKQGISVVKTETMGE